MTKSTPPVPPSPLPYRTSPGNNARGSRRQHRETFRVVGAARNLHLDPLALV